MGYNEVEGEGERWSGCHPGRRSGYSTTNQRTSRLRSGCRRITWRFILGDWLWGLGHRPQHTLSRDHSRTSSVLCTKVPHSSTEYYSLEQFCDDTLQRPFDQLLKIDGQLIRPDTAQWYPHFVLIRDSLYQVSRDTQTEGVIIQLLVLKCRWEIIIQAAHYNPMPGHMGYDPCAADACPAPNVSWLIQWPFPEHLCTPYLLWKMLSLKQ